MYTNYMGNFLLQCVRGGAVGDVLVVLPDGSRFWLQDLAAVAELMIDAPGHVVARAKDAVKDRRVRALPADELLRSGEVYLLVPEGKAEARLSDREVEAIRRLLSGKKGRNGSSRSNVRIFPEAAAGACSDEEDDAERCTSKHTHEPRFRHWRPALDTIYEA